MLAVRLQGTNRGFDEARGRYVVELADGRQIAARPGNVQSAEEAWVSTHASITTAWGPGVFLRDCVYVL